MRFRSKGKVPRAVERADGGQCGEVLRARRGRDGGSVRKDDEGAAEGLENIRTISDHKDLDFGQKYGFWIKELRLLARGTVIIDKAGIVRYVEYVSEVTHEPDYEAALACVMSL